jgi:hypothetical protein
MIGPSIQQQIDPLHTAVAELERLIGMQDELIIAGVCKGIDTIEAANKSTEMRGILAGMKTRAKKQAGKLLNRSNPHRPHAIGAFDRQYQSTRW